MENFVIGIDNEIRNDINVSPSICSLHVLEALNDSTNQHGYKNIQINKTKISLFYDHEV